MAGETERGKRVRLFVALELPIAVRTAIGVWARKELVDPALRPVFEESLHVTFAFLGSREPEQVQPLAAVLQESGGPAPLVELLEPAARPSRGQPRLFVLPVLSPGAEALRAGLVERLVAAGLFEPEGRPFWPHVTVARVRAEGRGSRRPARVERPPGALSRDLSEPFYGVRLALYRSQLQPTAARYVPLAQVELPGAGRQ